MLLNALSYIDSEFLEEEQALAFKLQTDLDVIGIYKYTYINILNYFNS